MVGLLFFNHDFPDMHRGQLAYQFRLLFFNGSLLLLDFSQLAHYLSPLGRDMPIRVILIVSVQGMIWLCLSLRTSCSAQARLSDRASSLGLLGTDDVVAMDWSEF